MKIIQDNANNANQLELRDVHRHPDPIENTFSSFLDLHTYLNEEILKTLQRTDRLEACSLTKMNLS